MKEMGFELGHRGLLNTGKCLCLGLEFSLVIIRTSIEFFSKVEVALTAFKE